MKGESVTIKNAGEIGGRLREEKDEEEKGGRPPRLSDEDLKRLKDPLKQKE